MPRYHPDFAAAQAALRAIFGKMLEGHYSATWKLTKDLQDWVTLYEKPSQAAQVDVFNLIRLAGREKLCINITC